MQNDRNRSDRLAGLGFDDRNVQGSLLCKFQTFHALECKIALCTPQVAVGIQAKGSRVVVLMVDFHERARRYAALLVRAVRWFSIHELHVFSSSYSVFQELYAISDCEGLTRLAAHELFAAVRASVAPFAKQLQVGQLVRTAFGQWHDMVRLQGSTGAAVGA